jgi:hypothetical protein
MAGRGALSACVAMLLWPALPEAAFDSAVHIVTRLLDEGLHTAVEPTLSGARDAVLSFLGTQLSDSSSPHDGR